MKYEAINNRVVVKQPNQKTTDAGIIIASPVEKPVIEVEVIGTTALTDTLQGKTVCVERRVCQELGDDGEYKYAAVRLEDILAVKL